MPWNGNHARDSCDPSRNRTCDLRFRKASLYPTELWDLVRFRLLGTTLPDEAVNCKCSRGSRARAAVSTWSGTGLPTCARSIQGPATAYDVEQGHAPTIEYVKSGHRAMVGRTLFDSWATTTIKPVRRGRAATVTRRCSPTSTSTGWADRRPRLFTRAFARRRYTAWMLEGWKPRAPSGSGKIAIVLLLLVIGAVVLVSMFAGVMHSG